MKPRIFFSALALVVVALSVIGLGGFWGLTARNPLSLINQGGQTLPSGTQFVPKSAPVTVSVLTRPDRLADLWLFLSTPNRRRQTQAEIERLEKTLLAGTDLSYEQDIRPWLGDEITFAITESDLDQDPENGRQPGYLTILSCQDSERAKAALELFWQRRAIAGNSLVFEQFAGSKLIYTKASTKSSSHSNLASAIVSSRFVLLANDPKVIQQALTSGQSRDLNLEQDSGYRKAMNSLPDKRVGLVFLNVPASLNWLGVATPNAPSLALSELGSADGVFDRAVLSLRLNRQGLLADTALLAAAGHQFQPQTLASSAPSLAASRLLPMGSPLVVVGENLNQLWQDLRSNLPYYTSVLQLSHPLWESLETALGGSPEPLLSWVKGDFALGLTDPSPQSQDWLLVAQHEAASQVAINDLDALAQRQGLSVGPLMLGEHPVTAWTRLSVQPNRGRSGGDTLAVTTQVAGLHTSLGDFDLFSTSPTALYKAFQSPDSSLDGEKQWQQAIAPFSRPNLGYLYLDWPALEPVLLREIPWLRLVETLGQPLFNHLQSVAITSYGRDQQLQSGAFFLQLSNP
ncbi:MAG TPA: DUF3352 domain-containing protein [Leptolyngbyaceae cyanobacterium]